MEVRYIEVQLYLVLKRHAVGLPPPQGFARESGRMERGLSACLS